MQKKPFRIVFMGTPQFAVPALETLISSGEILVGVVTQPDRPKGRGRRLTAPPVKLAAEAASLPVFQPEKIRSNDFRDIIESLAPDLIVVAAYGRILPASLLFLPPLGAINIHGSLLPKYRGAAPIQWALLNGEKETGVTIMQMDEGLDTGDILLPGSLPIGDDDTAGSLFDKIAELGGRLLVEALEALRQGTIRPIKQNENDATLAPLLSKEQGLIDWSRPAASISCQIRGLDPWPTAYTSFQGKRMRLFSPRVIDEPVTSPPGVLCRVSPQGLVIATGEGCLLVRELQKEGSKRMAVDVFLRGHSLSVGDFFD
ncbi:methionyl-tRNA formyltransferase [Thermodesulfobacteriota bacterium]